MHEPPPFPEPPRPNDIDNQKSFMGRYWFGVAVSILLASLTLLVSLGAIFVEHFSEGFILVGAYAAISIAACVGIPLLIALLVSWICYRVHARGPLPGSVSAAMFVPTLLALSLFPLVASFREASETRFHRKHPYIEELHVNLSGRDLWPATGDAVSTSSGGGPYLPMQAARPDNFLSFTRYPTLKEIEAGQFPYEGSRLRPGLATYTYGRDINGDTPLLAPVRPLVRLPYPDLASLLPYAGESELLVHQYFHYPDRVEVAPGLASLSGLTMGDLEGKVDTVVLFNLSISNQRPLTVVRLEVNGQTLALNGAIDRDSQCYWKYSPVGGALVDIDRPLHLRWQTLDDPQRWHQASVSVPAFAQAPPAGTRARWQQVLLYFMDKDQVGVERFQEMSGPDSQVSLHATGMPIQVNPSAVCGSAKDQYRSDMRHIP